MLYNIGDYKDHAKYIKLSLVKVEQLDAMIKAILTISRLEESSNVEGVDISSLVSRIIADNEILAQSRKLTIVNELKETKIALSKLAAEQVLRQVIGNAILYCREGGLIKVWADLVCLYVFDSCNKLSEAEIARSFELLPNELVAHSSSLGLFIVKNILNKYNLDFAFTNVDNGMCFKIQLSQKRS